MGLKKLLNAVFPKKRIYKDLSDVLMEPEFHADTIGNHKSDGELQTALRFEGMYLIEDLTRIAEYALLTNRFRAAIYLNLLITQRQQRQIIRKIDKIVAHIEDKEST